MNFTLKCPPFFAPLPEKKLNYLINFSTFILTFPGRKHYFGVKCARNNLLAISETSMTIICSNVVEHTFDYGIALLKAKKIKKNLN